ncbi:MAG: beta-eliminating lyase-related protein, partial [Alphaproteobacteria bacterium]|nr:beta-eliminating lyase-related protein [Alphaproteobacteria bacterium]
MQVSFASDNASGAHPAIMAAIAAANEGRVMAYGDDPITQGLAARFSEMFEHECAVYPVTTGTAANALALSQLSPSHGAIYCHQEAHLNVDECGAPELFTGGAKLIPIDGEEAKLTPDALEAAIFGAGDVHQAQPAALSISQATELGTLYRPAE